MSYMTISSQENHHFSLCSYFHAHPTTQLLKILGGPMHGPSPHLKFEGGPSPQSPSRSPPLIRPIYYNSFSVSARTLPNSVSHCVICQNRIGRYSGFR